LGIRYLWIDSLCIIQDDPEDWALESKRMSQYYGGASLTIAADAASSGNSVCLPRRPNNAWIEIVAERDPIYVRKLPTHFNMKMIRFDLCTPRALPLFGRAWAYQERLLSRRILHIGPEELVWECCTELLCECGQQPDHWSGVPEPDVQPFVASHRSALNKPWRWGEYWHVLLELYLTRAVSFESDRLSAIVGLAMGFEDAHAHLAMKGQAPKSLGVYMLGMWSSDLPRALLWINLSSPNPRNSCFPSWSWASMGGTWAYQGPPKASSFTPCARIISSIQQIWDIQRSPDAGRSDIAIVLSGPILSAHLDLTNESSQDHDHGRWYMPHFEDDPDLIIHVDLNPDDKGSLPIFTTCLYLGSSLLFSRHRCWVLILREIMDVPGYYERIGVLSTCVDFCNKADVKTIKII
jgi:hypothetical protein